MDLRHLSQKNAYFNAHVRRELWDRYAALFPTEAEACKRLRGLLDAAVVKTIADAGELDRIIEQLPSRVQRGSE